MGGRCSSLWFLDAIGREAWLYRRSMQCWPSSRSHWPSSRGVFVAFVSSLEPAEHLRTLSDVCRSFAPPATIERVAAAERADEVLAVLRQESTSSR